MFVIQIGLVYSILPFINGLTSFSLILWKKLDFFLFVWQFFTLYIILKLILTTNYFKKLFLTLIFLVLQSIVLGYYQVQVFMWFLLLNELAVGMVLFLVLLYANYPHTTKENRVQLLYLIFCIFFIGILISYVFPSFSIGNFGLNYEWIDYYKYLEVETLNDLVPLFYMYYFFYPNVLICVGVFLFLLSVIYLYSTTLIPITSAGFYKKDNYTQNHTLKSPGFKRFKSSKNDL